MAARLFKSVITASLFFLIMLSVTFAGSSYFLYDNLKRQYSEIVSEVRSRGVMIGSTLGKIASEMDQKKRDSQVLLSSAMYEIVRASGERDGQYVVDEIYYLDRNLKPIAHNEVSLIAKGSKRKFEGQSLTKAVHRTRRMSYDVEVESYFSNDGALPSRIYDLIRSRFPEFLAVRYHVSETVFPVDSEISSGAIHIYIRNTGFDHSFHQMVQYAGWLYLGSFIISAGSSLILMIIMLLTSSPKKGIAPSTEEGLVGVELPEPPEGIRLYRSAGGGESGLAMPTSVDTEVKILDAIPLADRLQGDR